MKKFTKEKRSIIFLIITIVVLIFFMILSIAETFNILSEKWGQENLKKAEIIAHNIEILIKKEIEENELIALMKRKEADDNYDNMNITIDSIENDKSVYAAGYLDIKGKLGKQYFNSGSLDKAVKSEIITNINKLIDIEAIKIYNGKSCISDLTKLSNGKNILIIISPIYKLRNEINGYIYRIIDIENINNNLSNNVFKDADVNYFLITNEGTLLLDSKNRVNKKIKDWKFNTKLVCNKILKGQKISNELYRLDESKNVFSSTPVIVQNRFLMTIGASVPRNAMYYLSKYIIALIAGCGILLIILICLIFRNYKKIIEKEKDSLYLETQVSKLNALQKMSEKSRKIQYEVIKSIVKLIEMKDSYTAGHSERVTEYAVSFGKYLGYSVSELEKLRISAILHDIGKIGVPEQILNKKEKLTYEEFSKIKQHTIIGYKAVKSISFLREELDMIRHHHERMDGKGYPDGLMGDRISEMTKILSICDAFDAMTSNRVYRKNLTFDQALEEIKINAGTQFDQKLANLFIENIIKQYYVNSKKIV